MNRASGRSISAPGWMAAPTRWIGLHQALAGTPISAVLILVGLSLFLMPDDIE
jgi:hypothetical protein